MCVSINIHTCIHTYIHIYIHIYSLWIVGSEHRATASPCLLRHNHEGRTHRLLNSIIIVDNIEMRTVLTAPYTLNRSIECCRGEALLLPSPIIGKVLAENDTLKVFKRQSAKMIPMARVHPDSQ